MALPVRKGYSGASVSTTLTSSPTNSDTTFTVAAVTNWPTTYPFYIVVDPGTTKEEKMKVSSVSTLTLTVVRGQDDTSAVAHSSGAICYPVFTADEADEANKIASVMTTKGDIISTNGTDINRLGVGTNTHVLQADSTATNGIKWGQVATAGIADDAVTLDKLADAVINKLVPVGTITAYGGASAPTGWLLCNGDAINVSYTTLIALVGANTPDLRGKFLLGKTASGTGSTLLGTGGSTTIAEANLPAHSHGVGTLALSTNGSHNHGGSTSTAGTHAHFYDRTTVTQRTVFNANDTIDDVVLAFSSSTTGSDGAHSHTISSDGGHTHTISGSTGTTGSGTAYFQPFTSVNYIIKHD